MHVQQITAGMRGTIKQNNSWMQGMITEISKKKEEKGENGERGTAQVNYNAPLVVQSSSSSLLRLTTHPRLPPPLSRVNVKGKKK